MVTQETKAHVANKGIELMNLHGFSNVTMTQIEREAFPSDDDPECTPVDGRIYQIFVSKEDISLFWLVQTMESTFAEVEKTILGFGRETVKFFLLTLCEVWIQQLTKRRVFVEGLVRTLVTTAALERRTLDHLANDTHNLLQQKFVNRFQTHLSIPKDDENYGEKQAVFLVQGTLGFVTMYWLQDRSVGFENTYRLADATTDLLCLTIAEGAGGAINGGMQAIHEIRSITENDAAFDTLAKLVPVRYLEGLPWNLVKMLYPPS